ncbi:MAG: hypothetical protein IPH11_11975 [Ignavibacteriales bacterium]|nr:hypothetical protein [Ignavibacteriales bacterium]
MAIEDKQFELLKTFHEQFAQNQNHHQNLFIKFLSAVFIVIAAYFIIYVNTQSFAKWHDSTFVANSNEITSYAILHLIGAYFIAQIIFLIMLIVVTNMGYNFRRDQKVNRNIRIKYLNKEVYKEIFSDKAFNTDKLTLRDYLPGFHLIFSLSIYFLQVLLLITIIFKSKSIEDLWIYPTNVVFITPLIISPLIYFKYYTKFKKKVQG